MSDTARIPKYSDAMNKDKKITYLKAKIVFLERCLNKEVLLPSNFRKGIDLDLLLIQQSRKLKNDIKLYKKQVSDFVFDKIRTPDDSLKSYEIEIKEYYKCKFNWLCNKQGIHSNTAEVRRRNCKKNKRDKQRYKARKLKKQMNLILDKADKMILNKSRIELKDEDKILLMHGLNFVPTPMWDKQVENKEWFSAMKHIRRVEWNNVLGKPQEEINTFPKKLKLPSLTRPNPNLIDDKTKAYTEMVFTKLRKLPAHVRRSFKYNNNLDDKLQQSLRNLMIRVRNKEIVICKADKDGKILILNFLDYDLIMKENLNRQFNNIGTTSSVVQQNISTAMKKCNDIMIKFHRQNIIDDKLLLHTTGIKIKNNKYEHVKGQKAKYFNVKNLAYAYPLFKTHKLNQDELKSTKIENIPVRLLQAAGNIAISRFTAFLEYILKPISIEFCKSTIDEYCRDSKDYLIELENWKNKTVKIRNNTNIDSTLFIVAADVQGLYPNINRNLLLQAVEHAMTENSTFTSTQINLFLKMINLCLENVITRAIFF